MEDFNAKDFFKGLVGPYIKFRIIGYASIWRFLSILIVGISLTLGYNLAIQVLQAKEILPASKSMQQIYQMSDLSLYVGALIKAPLFEELVFRGVFYMLIRRLVGYKSAALISAISFAVYHWDVSQGIYAFVFSFALVGIIRAYGDILSAILLHFTSNAFSIYMTKTGLFNSIMANKDILIPLMITCIIVGNLWIVLVIFSRLRYFFRAGMYQ